MLHPTSLGIRPQYIAEYLKEIAKTSRCPLDKIFMVCHGLYMDGTSSVLSHLTIVKGNDMVDGIHRRVPPLPLRPHLNGWLQACAEAWDKRENSTKPGRSHAQDGAWTLSQERDAKTIAPPLAHPTQSQICVVSNSPLLWCQLY